MHCTNETNSSHVLHKLFRESVWYIWKYKRATRFGVQGYRDCVCAMIPYGMVSITWRTIMVTIMGMSRNGNIFRVAGIFWGESTVHRWIPLTKASASELSCFCFICLWTKGWAHNRDAGDLIRHCTPYVVTVMITMCYPYSLHQWIYHNIWHYIWCSTIPHLPGSFCLWTFFQNIGFNMVPSNPLMSHLATQLGYSAGEFQALQLIVLATFGVVD